jgi:hypothetical protein
VIRHDGISKPVTFRNQPSSVYSGGILTDGKLGTEDYTDKNWLGFEKKI